MLAIVYISSAFHEFSDADLNALLSESRARNSLMGITGILLYKDGSIMQLLEGPDKEVKNLAARIYADPRHRGIIQLLEQPIQTREFPDWSMEFQDLSGPKLRKLALYMNEQSAAETLTKRNRSPILRLLASFGFRAHLDGS